MPEAITTKHDAIERVVNMFRERLESAFANGQRVRMDAREGAGTRRTVPAQVFAEAPLVALLKMCEPDGSFELHVYIEPKPFRNPK